MLTALERNVTLQEILIVGIEPARLGDAQRAGQSPAVWKRNFIVREGLGRRGTDRAGVGLIDPLGERLNPPRSTPTFERSFILRGRGGVPGFNRLPRRSGFLG